MQKESMKNLRFLLKNLHLHCKNDHTKRSHVAEGINARVVVRAHLYQQKEIHQF